jgi:hypothetical protein
MSSGSASSAVAALLRPDNLAHGAGSMVTAISAMVMVAAFIAAMATPLIGLDTTAFIAGMATLPIGHDTTAMVTVAVMAMVVAVAGRPEVMRSGEVSASPFDCKRGLTSTRSSASSEIFPEHHGTV